MLTFFDLSFLFPVILFYSVIRSTVAAPIARRNNTLGSLLVYKDYTSFQIGGGVGGNALEEAKAIFEHPFGDIPLVNVPYAIYERMLAMWEAVEYASIVGYPEAIEMAQSDADAVLEHALLVGEIKNTVLMRTAQVQLFRIKMAKDGSEGKDTDDTEEILSEFEEKLMTAVEDDRRNRGRISSSVPLVYPL